MIVGRKRKEAGPGFSRSTNRASTSSRLGPEIWSARDAVRRGSPGGGFPEIAILSNKKVDGKFIVVADFRLRYSSGIREIKNPKCVHTSTAEHDQLAQGGAVLVETNEL
jgi:hypothetical protein